MTRKPTWILVCDASRARLLRQEPNGGSFSLVEAFDHVESRLKRSELTTDDTGRKPVGPSVGKNGPRNGMGRPGVEPDTDPKEVEAEKFARELAHALEKGLNDHAYEQLIIAAPPHFLGLMKGTVSDQVAKHVDFTIDKDYTMLDPMELERRLRAARAA